jgi:Holliday junction resolvasome RuvABC endonuclease subunit
MEIFQALGKRPIVVIRLNPDIYKNHSMFMFSSSGIIQETTTFKERYDQLKEIFDCYLQNKPEKEITIEKLFFDI